MLRVADEARSFPVWPESRPYAHVKLFRRQVPDETQWPHGETIFALTRKSPEDQRVQYHPQRIKRRSAIMLQYIINILYRLSRRASTAAIGKYRLAD